jgi:hypothetical protein
MVGGRVSLDTAQLAEVVDGMPAVAGASADTENEQPTFPLTQRDQLVAEIFHNFYGRASRYLCNLREESRGVSHSIPHVRSGKSVNEQTLTDSDLE